MSTKRSITKLATPKDSKIGAMRIPTRPMAIGLNADVEWVQHALLEGISGDWVDFTGVITLKRMDERLDAHVDLTYAVECSCEVCGSTLRYTHHADVHLVYQPFTLDPRKSRHVKVPQTVKDLERISHQVTLQENQLDMGWYENGELDLATVLTETLVLEHPTLLECAHPETERLEDGECVTFPTEGQKNTHKPFANLPDLG